MFSKERSGKNMRVGIGFDIHRLVEGRPFIMGGVEIASEKGPEGHSDGDALCHAIADALLGAASLGDIGMWFPPDDPQYGGANSLWLLSKVAEGVREKGYSISNVDSVVICEAPKLSSFFDEMRLALSGALGIDDTCVSVKATTYEGLGEIGRGEAVAAKAVALID